MTIKRLIIVLVVTMAIYIIGIILLLLSAYQKLDQTTIAAIIGGLVGTLGGVLGAVIVAIVTIWEKSQENQEKTKDRVAEFALEVTKLDYQLRQQELTTTSKKKQFYAPAKVYREFYKALLEFEQTGHWPKNIEELGLLNIIELGTDKSPQNKPKGK